MTTTVSGVIVEVAVLDSVAITVEKLLCLMTGNTITVHIAGDLKGLRLATLSICITGNPSIDDTRLADHPVETHVFAEANSELVDVDIQSKSGGREDEASQDECEERFVAAADHGTTCVQPCTGAATSTQRNEAPPEQHCESERPSSEGDGIDDEIEFRAQASQAVDCQSDGQANDCKEGS